MKGGEFGGISHPFPSFEVSQLLLLVLNLGCGWPRVFPWDLCLSLGSVVGSVPIPGICDGICVCPWDLLWDLWLSLGSVVGSVAVPLESDGICDGISACPRDL